MSSQPLPEPLRNFYFYQMDGGQLTGSENPSQYPNAVEIVRAVVECCHIRAMVSLVPDFTDYGIAEIIQYHHPLPNNRIPTRSEVIDIVNIIRPHRRRGEHVWCHCQRGTDRTGCVLGGVLADSGLPVNDVVRQLTSHFPAGRRTPQLLALWEPYEEIIRSLCDE